MEKITYSEVFEVSLADCISEIDNSLPNILGTYTIVKWMEIVSAKNINRKIEKNYISVGKVINIEHIGMAKVGDIVKITSEIKLKEKRNVEFAIIAMLDNEIIAKATHKRVIIPTRLLEKMIYF